MAKLWKQTNAELCVGDGMSNVTPLRIEKSKGKVELVQHFKDACAHWLLQCAGGIATSDELEAGFEAICCTYQCSSLSLPRNSGFDVKDYIDDLMDMYIETNSMPTDKTKHH